MSPEITNEDIAAVFEEMADLLDIAGDNPFKIRAYRNAARTLRNLPREAADLLRAGEDLTRLPGIGKELAAKIRELVETGRLRALDKLHRRVPESLEELLQIPGLGPKRVAALWHALGIRNLRQLEQAARSGELDKLPGFGRKTIERILAAIEEKRVKDRRFLRHDAARHAEALRAWLLDAEGVQQVVVAGSFRRGRDTVGDLDVLVTVRDGTDVMTRFTGWARVARVVSRGITRSTVFLKNGLQVDLRVVLPEQFGAALAYFTGSRAHSIRLRRMAQEQGLKINEYGVFRDGRIIAGETEESVYASVGLPWIPPELRENRGEFEAAREGRLPKLIQRADLRGDLHCHTEASDGHGSLREMAEAARAAGLEYLAVTDHSPHIGVVHGLDENRLLRQLDEIDRLNEELDGITLLKGMEVDILEDGRLDMPDAVLSRLDVVIGAVHSHFRLGRARQTRRLLRALENPCIHLIAHPSGRLIQRRQPIDLDWPRFLDAVAERGCLLELNSQPLRLDLDDIHARQAKERGIGIAINSDAHGPADFALLDEGVLQARRGWLEAGDVINTLPLDALRRRLARARG
ncbi:MAG: DNA polymerase/3'-5' exonuclease PolX [Gammaproteobacteria bacterium]|nr:MAG: DNA polymerase/3'-5' exonuclease PolX [Gammaproteobacteria bacterium]